jgi:hypothetical protein
MKYLCIKNTQSDNDGSKWFTVGKWYEVTCEEIDTFNRPGVYDYFSVTNIGNKAGMAEEFLNEHFMSTTEYRLKKINEYE